jgi:hypothetical protein
MNTDPTLPSGGQMWWRATLRARMEASSRRALPVGTMAPAIAAAAAIGLLALLAVIAWPWVTIAATWLMAAAERVDPAAAQAGSMLVVVARWSLPFVPWAAACVLVAAAGVYIALPDGRHGR